MEEGLNTLLLIAAWLLPVSSDPCRFMPGVGVTLRTYRQDALVT
jgi:hypothetical protein